MLLPHLIFQVYALDRLSTDGNKSLVGNRKNFESYTILFWSKNHDRICSNIVCIYLHYCDVGYYWLCFSFTGWEYKNLWLLSLPQYSPSHIYSHIPQLFLSIYCRSFAALNFKLHQKHYIYISFVIVCFSRSMVPPWPASVEEGTTWV